MGALSAVRADIVPSPRHVAGPGIGDPAVRLEVRLFGEPGAVLRLAQCVAGVLESTPPSIDGCALRYPGLLFGPDPIELDVTARDRIAPASGVPEIACADDPGGCIRRVRAAGQ